MYLFWCVYFYIYYCIVLEVQKNVGSIIITLNNILLHLMFKAENQLQSLLVTVN